MKKKIAVLASGSGSNLQSLIDAIVSNYLQNAEIVLVISNKENAYALERARLNGIKDIFLNPKDFSSYEEYDKKIISLLKENNIDFIVLAGYLKILTEVLVREYKNKIINIHPSLLPAFGGKGMYGNKVHEAVLKSGVKESGCTVHFVTIGIDEGPIISQKKVAILPNDTVDTLSARVLEEEHKLIVESVRQLTL